MVQSIREMGSYLINRLSIKVSTLLREVASWPGHTLVLQSGRGSSNGIERVVGTNSTSQTRFGSRNLAAMTGGNR